ncbi:MAG: type II secretion system F family protein [Comamonadaceae bacterium]|nr:type II secretion system F family protein [Comamonadaceae bacterium]
MNILPALELLSLQQEKHRLRMILFELYQHVYNGLSLSKALASRPKEFPKLLILMVEVGELSGSAARHDPRDGRLFRPTGEDQRPDQGRAPHARRLSRRGAIDRRRDDAVRVPQHHRAVRVVWRRGTARASRKFFLAAGDFMAQNALPLFGGIALAALVVTALDQQGPRVPPFARRLPRSACPSPGR